MEVNAFNNTTDKYKNIPDILKQQPQWVVWGVVGEPLKAPFNPAALLSLRTVPAKSGVPETWSSFDAAKKCVEQGLAKGIGYEFNGQGRTCLEGIYGVDLDHVIDCNGVITPQALEIVEGLASYTEISPSGNGLHIFVTAENVNLTRHRKQGGFIEIYDRARYFTVTGKVYGGYNQINERSTELQKLHDQYFQLTADKGQLTVKPDFSTVNSQLSPVNYLKRGLEKDRVLLACWNGEQRQSDESASDQALMNKLAYWCNANLEAIIVAFIQSPYYAQKSEAHKKKCQREDYLPRTAQLACRGLRSTAHEDTMRYRQRRSQREAR